MNLPQKLLWALVVLALLATLGAAGWSQVLASRRPAPEPEETQEQPPVIGEWSLTERSGRPFGSADLQGRVWVANFIFTNCAGPCPVMTQSMEKLIALLPNEPEMRFVTFSVDPKRDTPEVLREFAARHRQDPRWFFVTGWPVYNLVYDRFKMMARPAENPTPGQEIIHSTSFVLIDGTGTMRGLYDYKIEFDDYGEATKTPDIRRLAEDVRKLLHPPPPPDPRASAPAWARALPSVNAGLNGLAAVLLLTGLYLIKTKRIGAHRVAMISACAVSAAFLACYVVYHVKVGSVPYTGPAWSKAPYYGVLISHVVLAAFVLPLAVTTLWLGMKERFQTHRGLARWTLPIWMYVSVTGILVYVMVYGVGRA